MAEKRMFSNKITQSDPFLAMPASSQNLYFHLNMDADDEGFINRPKSIMRMIGSTEDDMNLLILKKFVIPFNVENDSGINEVILVVKHWFIHNTLRKDRMKLTNHLEQRNLLTQNKNGSYSLLNSGDMNNVRQVSVKCPPSVVENRVVESSVVENSVLEEDPVPYLEIIQYLNLKTGKEYKNAKGHQAHIKARWNDGYRIEDFKKVIDNKVHSWKDDPMAEGWLRPRTLFGPKFDDYLNERIITNSPSVKNGSIRSEVVMHA